MNHYSYYSPIEKFGLGSDSFGSHGCKKSLIHYRTISNEHGRFLIAKVYFKKKYKIK